jgi:pimeloyl-ACP methyl ester carboxylesterase
VWIEGTAVANLSHSEAYRFVDHVVARAVRSLSRIIGVKNIMRPFWNRWRASLIGEETLMRFLASIRSIDDWPATARRVVEAEEAQLTAGREALPLEEQVHRLRRLALLYHLAQWGCIPLTEEKVECHRRSRDYYVQAERLAHGERYRRLAVDWEGGRYWGNLHLPAGEGPWPLLVLVHGMDDAKEEHLATELHAQRHGYAVFCADGPGQGEALLLGGTTWPANLWDFIRHTVTVLVEGHGCDPERVGLLGVSWGGMWALLAAARDPRVRGVYDLGGPVDARQAMKLPFFLKSKFCQVLGIRGPEDFVGAEEAFSLRRPGLLEAVRCPVRVIHGGRDPLVPTGDKEWLCRRLRDLHAGQDVSLVVLPNGDHCCTGEAAWLRDDLVRWLDRVLGPLPGPGGVGGSVGTGPLLKGVDC